MGFFKRLKKSSSLREGFDFAKQGKYFEAIDCFDKVLDHDINHYDAWFNKGITYMDLKETRSALECFDRALKLEPKKSINWHAKGLVLIELEKNQEALNCFNKALQLDPDFKSAKKAVENLRFSGKQKS